MKLFDTMNVRASIGGVLILVAVYFLQAATPLRLHYDTVVLLSVAETAEKGGGYLYHGQPTVIPPGYPTLVAFLIRVNLAEVWVIVSLSVVFVVIGLLAVCSIIRTWQVSDSYALGVCILSLLSFVFVKYSVIPLTDTMYFGVSMACLALMTLAPSRYSWRALMGIVILVAVAICTRRIGVALIPALLHTVIGQFSLRHYFMRLSVPRKAAMLLVAVSVCSGLVGVIRGTSTLVDFKSVLAGHSLIDAVRGILAMRVTELGEIAVNLPYSAIPQILQRTIPLIGISVIVLVCIGVACRKQFGAVETYFVSYVAVMLAWPFYDPRFWLPVIPFLIAYSGLALKRLIQRQVLRFTVEGYVMMFVILGTVTLMSSTRLSYSGSGFADLYPEYHSTYCAVWHCKESDSANIDLDGLHLLRYYKQNPRSLAAR